MDNTYRHIIYFYKIHDETLRRLLTIFYNEASSLLFNTYKECVKIYGKNSLQAAENVIIALV